VLCWKRHLEDECICIFSEEMITVERKGWFDMRNKPHISNLLLIPSYQIPPVPTGQLKSQVLWKEHGFKNFVVTNQ